VPARRATLPLVVVQYGKYPVVSDVDVPTVPVIPRVDVETLSTPPLFTRPVPSNEVKVEPPRVKLVTPTFVEVALVNDAFVAPSVVAKRFVEVALVKVALGAVKVVPLKVNDEPEVSEVPL